MDKLTEMHLMLREAGWEPELDTDTFYQVPFWRWTRPDDPDLPELTTGMDHDMEPPVAIWFESPERSGVDVDSLRARLQELAQQK